MTTPDRPGETEAREALNEQLGGLFAGNRAFTDAEWARAQGIPGRKTVPLIVDVVYPIIAAALRGDLPAPTETATKQARIARALTWLVNLHDEPQSERQTFLAWEHAHEVLAEVATDLPKPDERRDECPTCHMDWRELDRQWSRRWRGDDQAHERTKVELAYALNELRDLRSSLGVLPEQPRPEWAELLYELDNGAPSDSMLEYSVDLPQGVEFWRRIRSWYDRNSSVAAAVGGDLPAEDFDARARRSALPRDMSLAKYPLADGGWLVICTVPEGQMQIEIDADGDCTVLWALPASSGISEFMSKSIHLGSA